MAKWRGPRGCYSMDSVEENYGSMYVYCTYSTAGVFSPAGLDVRKNTYTYPSSPVFYHVRNCYGNLLLAQKQPSACDKNNQIVHVRMVVRVPEPARYRVRACFACANVSFVDYTAEVTLFTAAHHPHGENFPRYYQRRRII